MKVRRVRCLGIVCLRAAAMAAGMISSALIANAQTASGSGGISAANQTLRDLF